MIAATVPIASPVQTIARGQQAVAACNALLAERDHAIEEARQWSAGELIVEADEPFCLGWRVVAVKRDESSLADRTARWTVRRWAHPFTRPMSMDWAISGQCQAIVLGLRALSRFSVTLRLDGLSPQEPTSVPMLDGISYTVQSSFLRQPDGRSLQMSVTTNQGAVADWAAQWLVALDACWRPGAPPTSD